MSPQWARRQDSRARCQGMCSKCLQFFKHVALTERPAVVGPRPCSAQHDAADSSARAGGQQATSGRGMAAAGGVVVCADAGALRRVRIAPTELVSQPQLLNRCSGTWSRPLVNRLLMDGPGAHSTPGVLRSLVLPACLLPGAWLLGLSLPPADRPGPITVVHGERCVGIKVRGARHQLAQGGQAACARASSKQCQPFHQNEGVALPTIAQGVRRGDALAGHRHASLKDRGWGFQQPAPDAHRSACTLT